MKRCPECRRDYYDDSLRYCLDDGSVLLDGPAVSDARTVIFPHREGSPGTSPQIKDGEFSFPSADFDSSQEFTRVPIIGREKQISEIIELLGNGGVRLVTLTGTGGTGKTRLALEAARRMRKQFADGVFVAELAAISDPSLVLPTIAHCLAVSEADPRTSFDALADNLRGRQMLIVLDNFEQVVDAGPGIVQLLRVAPGVQVLVTSREPLRVSVETEYPVPPMGIPAPGVQESVSSLVQYEAVELFVERAKQVRQDFALTDENVEAVISICRKLDGLPLALELAAARARVLSASEILERLQDRLKLLTGGSRDLPGRQQTMRAAIEWSYELLSDSEKDVFSKLSVFRGGFSYNDAETVIRQSSSDRTVDSDVEILDIITYIN